MATRNPPGVVVGSTTGNTVTEILPTTTTVAVPTGVSSANIYVTQVNNRYTNTTVNRPGGNVDEVQFRGANGSFAGDSEFRYDPVNNVLNLDGNIQVKNIKAVRYLYANGAAIPMGYGNSNVATFLPTYGGNLQAGRLHVVGLTSLGAVSNVSITGGSSGQFLTTNGNGALSWSNPSEGGNANYANYSGTAFSVTGANVSGIVALANFSNFSNRATVANSALTVAGANVTGTVPLAQQASTVTTPVQPAITALGTLVTLSVEGNVHLGDVSNITIEGGSNGQVLSTDGAGNLSWKTVTGGGNGSPGGSDGQIQFNAEGSFGGDSGLTYDSVTGTMAVDNVNDTTGRRITNFYDGNGTLIVGSNMTQTPVSILIGGAGPRNEWQFTPDGLTTFPGGAIVDSADSNFEVRGINNVNLEAAADINLSTGEGNSQWKFDGDGVLHLPGAVYSEDSPSTIRNYYGFVLHPPHNTGGTGPELSITYNDGLEITPITNDYYAGGDTAAPLYITGAYINEAGKNPGPVVIQGGRNFATGAHAGISVITNNKTWSFDPSGTLSAPGDITAQGNVTADNIGNIAALDLNGNASQVLAGDGTWVDQASGGTSLPYLELTNTGFIGDAVVFTKTNYGTEVDNIDTDVAITRGNNQGIYNPIVESGWDSNLSPANTEWNADGWDDLTNVTTRTYTTFYNAVGGNLGNNILGLKLVMHDTVNDKYYTFLFSQWTQNNAGGGFSYARHQLDVANPNVGIRFADGTIQSTAYTGNTDKTWTSPNDNVWKIVEYSGGAAVQLSWPSSDYSTTATDTQVDAGTLVINANTDPGAANAFNQLISVTYNGNTYTTNGWGSSGNVYTITFTTPFPVYTPGDSVTLTYGNTSLYPQPVVWWDAANSPGGAGNFRGAIIEYHAYSDDAGTIIGTIHVAQDDEQTATHTEASSGGNDLGQIVLWDRSGTNTQVLFRRTDLETDTLFIQWTSKIFYGSEYYC